MSGNIEFCPSPKDADATNVPMRSNRKVFKTRFGERSSDAAPPYLLQRGMVEGPSLTAAAGNSVDGLGKVGGG